MTRETGGPPGEGGDGKSSRSSAARVESSRVLLACADRKMRDGIRRLLSSRYEVEAVGDGNEALGAIERSPPDLVLSDDMTAYRDSFAFMRQLRANPQTSALPVIVLSGRGGREGRLDALERGADDYLASPLDARELQARVGANLEFSRARHEAIARETARCNCPEQARDVSRRKSEVPVPQSEERFRFLAESLPQGIYTVTPDGVVNYVNERLLEFFGVPLDELRDWRWTRFVHPDDLEGSLRTVRHCLETGEFYQHEHRFRRKDGVYRWHIGRAQPMRDSEGGIVLWIGSITDVDDLKRAEMHARFLADLSLALQPLTEPEESVSVACRLLGEFLKADRCVFAEVDTDQENLTVTGNYTRGETPDMLGRHRLSDFGGSAAVLLRGNHVFRVADIESEAFAGLDLTAFRTNRVRAVVTVPLFKSGRLVACMALHQMTSRQWSDPEVELVRTAVYLCWESIERTRITKNLHESQEWLRLAQQAGRVGMFEWFLREDRVVWTGPMERLYGLAEGEFEGTYEAWRKRVLPEDATRLGAEIAECLRRRQTDYSFEFRTVFSDGTSHWIAGQSQFLYDSQGNPERMIGVNADIDARKRIEEMLRESEASFRNLANAAPAILWIADPNGMRSFLSRGWNEFTGQTEDDGLGDGWKNAVHPADREKVAALLDAANKRREPFSLDYRLLRHDGVYRWVFDSAHPRYEPNGTYLGLVGSVFDVDTRKVAEERLARLNAELARARDEALAASHAKSLFLATMSHELRTPLNAIIGYAELLEEELESSVDDKTMEDLGRIRNAGYHLLRLINEVLDMTKIEAGKVQIAAEKFDAMAAVSQIAEIVRPMMEANGNTLEIRCSPSLGSMYSDPTRVRQILLNLLSNAAKFTQNGNVILECSRGRGPDGGEQLEFRVTDTGMGLDRAQVERLFEKFYQVDPSSTRKHGGTGLGLPITRELCRLLGGSISVESERGRGSVFTVRLPAAVAPAAPKDSETTET